MKKPILFLLVGYPGAGKTMISRMIAELTDAAHIWADQERVSRYGKPTFSNAENKEFYDELNAHTDKLLSQGVDVIFDTSFNYRSDRDHLRSIADKNNAEVKLLWIRTKKELAYERATKNAHEQDTRPLSDMHHDDFHRLSDSLEEPTKDENAIELVGEDVTAGYLKTKLNLHD
ncbi:MAG: ATP-binding protein [bacterium]|nr:ATP-binding protein [bacterium]